MIEGADERPERFMSELRDGIFGGIDINFDDDRRPFRIEFPPLNPRRHSITVHAERTVDGWTLHDDGMTNVRTSNFSERRVPAIEEILADHDCRFVGGALTTDCEQDDLLQAAFYLLHASDRIVDVVEAKMPKTC